MSKEAKTTLVYKGVEYPFYKTNQGQWDFETAGFSNEGLFKGNARDTLALVYFTLRECARRSGRIFDDTLEQFIAGSDTDVTDVFQRLKAEKDRIKQEEAKEPGKSVKPEKVVAKEPEEAPK